MNKLILGVITVIAIVGIFFLIPPAEKEGATVTNPTPTNTSSESDHISATKAVIETDRGMFELELYAQDAPKTVTNFATLAKRGYYNGLTFHRVEIGIVQGGDPKGDGSGGTSIYGAKFEDELNPATGSYQAGYAEGVIAMANAGPNTNGSQFFINQIDNNDKFAKNYTIFGKVTSGLDVVKKIQKGDKIKSISVN